MPLNVHAARNGSPTVLAATGADEAGALDCHCADRVWLRWISASEGGRFAETIHEIVADLKQKGPNTLAQSWAV